MVVVASVAFGIAGAFMKTSDGFMRLWPSIVVALLFVGGAICLSHTVRAQGLTSAYVIGLGLEAIVTAGLGRFLFGEHLNLRQALGVLIIVAGVAAVRYG